MGSREVDAIRFEGVFVLVFELGGEGERKKPLQDSSLRMLPLKAWWRNSRAPLCNAVSEVGFIMKVCDDGSALVEERDTAVPSSP